MKTSYWERNEKMSEPFYQKLISLLLGLALLILAVFASAILFLLAFSTQIPGALYAFLGVLILSCIYGAYYFLQAKHFKEDMHLYIPGSENKQLPGPLEASEPDGFDDRAVKACFYYRHGASFDDIAKRLGLIHRNQGKRELIKGLDILLQSYRKHEGKNPKCV